MLLCFYDSVMTQETRKYFFLLSFMAAESESAAFIAPEPVMPTYKMQ